MSGSNGNSKIIDIKQLKEIMDNDLELIQNCFTDFLSEWPLKFQNNIHGYNHTIF